ncbi:mitochondrial morphogenesis protein Sld7p [Monosporozyma unispora]|nr:mitochondrial morphogenesis protein [Kazachstania unispora]
MKHAVVSLALGHGNNKILIRDIQLWNEDNTKETSHNKDESSKTNSTITINWNGKCLSYVSVKKLPLWIYDRDQLVPWRCYTGSSKTWSYFNIKLKRLNRALIAEIYPSKTDNNMLVLFYVDSDSIRCRLLCNKSKYEIDKIITNKAKKPQSPVNKKVQFNDTLSKLILTGLRLRDIPNTNPGFTKLYKITFQAAEFTHRDDVKRCNYQVPFETLQQTVETLLKLFTKT